jgi:predicted Zn-dependent protease
VALATTKDLQNQSDFSRCLFIVNVPANAHSCLSAPVTATPHRTAKSVSLAEQRFGVRSQGDYNTRFQAMTQPQKKTRRQMLEEFVATKPNDAFARYGLAMECANSGDAGAADEQFKTLLTAHPDYVAAYFQYGQYLARAGRTEEARSTLSAGVSTARRTGDDHARSEMEAALAELG